MKRCFLLVLIFISMATGSLAVSGSETIVWENFAGLAKNSMFSHNNKLIGFYGNERAGVIRVSDGTLLWKDSIRYFDVRSMDFSKNDSLFAYTRIGDKRIFIKYSATGATYKNIPVDSLVSEIRFLDSTRLVVKSETQIYIVDIKDSAIVYSEPSKFEAHISKTGKYYLVPQQDPLILFRNSVLRTIYRDSIDKQIITFTGHEGPTEKVLALLNAFSHDDKLLVQIPIEPGSHVGNYPEGMPMYIYNLETTTCSFVMVPEITETAFAAFIDADKKHIIIFARSPQDPDGIHKNQIVSLENGSITNIYPQIDFASAFLKDASQDSLHYVGTGGGGVALLNAFRTGTGIPPIIKPNVNIKVFPNPSSSSGQTISIEGISEAKSIIISDLFGREMFRNEYVQSNDGNVLSIRLPQLQKGMYFISIIDSNGRNFAKKLIIAE